MKLDRRLTWTIGAFWLAAPCLLLLLAGPAPALAQPKCLPKPAAGALYLCDELKGSTKGTRHGGKWVPDGWEVTAFKSRIVYDLGAAAGSGRLSFFVRGITMASLSVGTGSSNKAHLIEMFDKGGRSTGAQYVLNIRTWGGLNGTSWHGKLKLTCGHLGGAKVQCPGPLELPIGNFDTSKWKASKWLHFEATFGGGVATVSVDGRKWGTLKYGKCPAHLRMIHVPIDPWVSGAIDSVKGAIYSHVSFSGTRACADPCTDGNPCTTGDKCVSGVCTGEKAKDGTRCAGKGFAGECRAGACTELPPKPEPVPEGPPRDSGAPDDGTAMEQAGEATATDGAGSAEPGPDVSAGVEDLQGEPVSKDDPPERPEVTDSGAPSADTAAADDDGGGCVCTGSGSEGTPFLGLVLVLLVGFHLRSSR